MYSSSSNSDTSGRVGGTVSSESASSFVAWIPPAAPATMTTEQDAARRALPRWQQQQQQQQIQPAAIDAVRPPFKTDAAWPAPAARLSNNLDRKSLQSHAAQLVAMEREADLAAMRATAYPASAAPAARPQGPRPHMYASLAEDPLPQLSAGCGNTGPTLAHLERLRAIEATAGPAALLPPTMAQHVSELVDRERALRRQ